MKQGIDWNDEPELFEAIVQVLEDMDQDEVQVRSSTEQGEYREDGTIILRTSDGRRFSLDLSELS